MFFLVDLEILKQMMSIKPEIEDRKIDPKSRYECQISSIWSLIKPLLLDGQEVSFAFHRPRTVNNLTSIKDVHKSTFNKAKSI